MAKLLQEISQTPYDYYFDLVGDGNFGSRDADKGCWNGMIGELIDTRGCPNGTRKVLILHC